MSPLRPTLQRNAGLVLMTMLLGACAVGPDFVQPRSPDADRYTSQPFPEASISADGRVQHFLPGDASIPSDWWTLFKSSALDAVVRRAIANNPTLQASEASLRQSQNNLRAGYGIFFPQANADMDASRERTSAAGQGPQNPSRVFTLIT